MSIALTVMMQGRRKREGERENEACIKSKGKEVKGIIIITVAFVLLEIVLLC